MKTDNDYWNNTDMLARTRYSYLRRECLRIYHPDKVTSSIWDQVDKRLDYLHSKGRAYTTCFYNIIYQKDRQQFDCRTIMYDEIPNSERSFNMPTDAEVEAEIPHLKTRKPTKKKKRSN